MIAACGAFALSGFPLDDMWHRIFGQDVTLWGPTHLMLIGGGSLATLGSLILLAEAVRHLGRDPERQRRAAGVYYLRRALLVGGLLVALSTFQGEFDFGVPQFRLVLHPVLIMLAAGIGLVAARIYLGRGGALLAVLGFLLIRGFRRGGRRGVRPDHAALPALPGRGAGGRGGVPARGGRSPVAVGALAGVLIGTAGLAAEWGWSQVWMPILELGAASGGGARRAGGGRGGGRTGRLRGVGPDGGAAQRGASVGSPSAVPLVAVVAWGVPLSDEGRAAPPWCARRGAGLRRPRRAGRGLDRAGRFGGGRSRVRQHHRMAGRGACSTHSSGRDPASTARPSRSPCTAAGRRISGCTGAMRSYRCRSTCPRTARYRRPRPAPARFTRPFQADIELLQRERKPDVPGALSAAAYLTVLAIVMSLFAFFAWALLRLGRGGPRRQHQAAGPVPPGESRLSVS